MAGLLRDGQKWAAWWALPLALGAGLGVRRLTGMLAGRGHLHYATFDVLWLNGRDLRALPLGRRKQRLERLIPTTTPVLSRIFSIERRGSDMLAAVQQLDLEGIVAAPRAGAVPIPSALAYVLSEGHFPPLREWWPSG